MGVKKLSAFNYFGGKTLHLDWLLPLFPAVNTYRHYVELFAGSAVVFLNKQPSPIETITDIDGNLINFFSVLRDEPEQLISKLQLTPYSRNEFMQAMDPTEDAVERARRFFTRVMQSFGGADLGTYLTGWRPNYVASRNHVGLSVNKWWSKVYGLEFVINRLRMAQIENRDFKYILKTSDTPETFFYADPPYPHESRVGKKNYKHEFTVKQHKELAHLLYKAKGKWAVSSYDCELYQKLYTDKGYFKTIGPEQKSTLGKSTRREVLYTNYNPQQYQTLKLF